MTRENILIKMDPASTNVSAGNHAYYTDNIYLRGVKEVDTWFLMGGPIPVILIVATYLLIVLKIGPAFMRDRKPINIKSLMLLYNLYQTIYNAFIVSTLFTTSGAFTYVIRHSCTPIDPAINHYLPVLNTTSWYYFMSKVADLLDTFFFILRKKDSHLTFLHIYHHANMVTISWVYLKYIKGEQGAIIGWLNALVHVVMYSYYFLSALGPEVQKYLWWKRYITKFQMIQFVLIITYMLGLMLFNCTVSPVLSGLMIVQAVTFLILFTRFYIKSYLKSGSSNKSNNTNNSNNCVVTKCDK